ncbi:MAG: flagellar motor protein MotB [Gammaproteobacteria bacterium]|nr:flagellar motor protein MotB [Gammaproteobacteria bacterium]
MDEAERPMVIKKIKKAGHGHHGGAWKVAFADFATAMMAFFLLMWLLAAATPEQQEAISGFFDADSEIGVGQGSGFSDSMIDLGGTGDTTKGAKGDEWEQGGSSNSTQKDGDGSGQSNQEMAEEAKQMEELLEVLKEAIENKEELKAYKDQLKLSVTPEGLRIQIVDKENRPMFESGKAIMREHATKILNEIAPIISKAGNRISLTGHTDAARFFRKDGYSNWELSADRANAARRALINAGMSEKKVGRVVGLADSSLYNRDNPLDPINRRISIVVMNKATDEAIGREDGALKVDSDSVEGLDLNNPPSNSNPLEGISESVINDANAIKSDNVIVDTLKAPEPTATPAIDQEPIKLPDISIPELNKIVQEAGLIPQDKAEPLVSDVPSEIKIDFGIGLPAAKPAPDAAIKPNAPPIIMIDLGIDSPSAKTALQPVAKPKAAAPVPAAPVTPGAVPLSLPGL